jgi:pyruvate dehydrogenase E2 component (dihydrolipoamide acetyltransferase)
MADTEIIMPQLGFDMTEGKIGRWLKHEGDPIARGEPIAEVETEKVTLQVEAVTSGTLSRILHPEGDTVPVGEPIAELREAA